MSISTEIDLLIANMIIFSRLDASFPVKVSKMSKLKKMSNSQFSILNWVEVGRLRD